MKELLPDATAMWQQHPAPSNSAGRTNSTSQLSVDSNMYRRNLVQTSPGCSSVSMVGKQQQQQQDPFNLLQHTAQSTLLDNTEQQRLQMPTFHHSQNLTQPMFLHDSSPQAESIEWINEAHNNILSIKETYIADLQMLHIRAQEMRRRAQNVETANKADRTRMTVERMMSFLNMSASDLLPMGREKVYQYMNNVMRQLQHHRAAGNSLQAKQAPTVEPSFTHSDNTSHNIQQRDNYHQIQSLRQVTLPQTQFNSFKIGSSLGMNNTLSTMNNTSHYNNNSMRPTHQWAPQGSPLRMLLHNQVGVSQQHNNTSSQVSSRNIFNSFDYSMPPLQNNQQKIKQQMMSQSDKNKQQMFQKWNEDSKMRQMGQRWSPVLPPSPLPYAISPQQSSSQFDLKDLSNKFFKSVVPASSSALPSPLTPSSNPTDSASSPLIEESSKIAKSSSTSPQLVLPDKIPSQVSSDTQRLTKSCLNRESSGDKQSRHYKGDASKRLVEVVKKISSSTLKATLRDISAVTTLNDRITGHFLDGDPTKFIFHDLVDEIKGGIPRFEHETGLDLRIKRKLDAEVINNSITEMESDTSGRIKRQKKEVLDVLLKEIKEINERLIEVVVDVMAEKNVVREGTLVRCSYIPIGFSSNIKTSNTSKHMFPNLLLDLIVYPDYPDSSPTVLENTPSCFRDDLWMKAKSSFSLSVKKLSEPISVKDMAETWDVSAREVFHDFAEQIGGGNFSSIYGKWENCAVAG